MSDHHPAPPGTPAAIPLMRLAGVFYLLNIGFGAWAAISMAQGSATLGVVANAVAAVCYVVVTVALFLLLAPTNRAIAGIAALVSLAGCLVSILAALGLAGTGFNPLPLFGIYCLMTGWLIVQSRLVPAWIGYALMVGGIGWLTFAIPDLRRALVPYNMAPAILAESALAIALLIRRPRAIDPA